MSSWLSLSTWRHDAGLERRRLLPLRRQLKRSRKSQVFVASPFAQSTTHKSVSANVSLVMVLCQDIFTF
jgi:hypothetical protein